MAGDPAKPLRVFQLCCFAFVVGGARGNSLPRGRASRMGRTEISKQRTSG